MTYLPKSCLPADQYAIPRQLNTQINQLESRQFLPICTSRPLRLGLDISSVCNIKCIFCLADTGRKKASDPNAFRPLEWIEHFDPLLPFVQHATFSSFEAILNPQFDQFVIYLRRFQTPFQLFSNGLGLTQELGEFLLENGLISLWCSFHAAKAKTYESIMNGSDYDNVIRNLLHMKHYARKRGLPWNPTMVFCAMRRNIDELPLYVDLAKRIGAPTIQVNYLLVTRENTSFEKESVYFHQDLYDYNVCSAKLKAAKMGIRLNHQPLFSDAETATNGPCYRPWEHLNVSQHGAVQICCGGSPMLGNMFEQGFSRIWNSQKMIEFRARVNSHNPPAACLKCTRGRENPKDIATHLTYL